MVKSMMKFWSKKANDGKKPNQKKRAFTLVEILIVVAVIGILFVTLVPRIDFAGDKARETGIKTDFRSFELAAEQLIRENAGLADFDDVEALTGENGINMYLDKAIRFDDAGECAKQDQWNQPYTMQIVASSDGNPNNGAIMFISNGKDSTLDETEDNYALVVTYYDGQIESETIGFSTNIESSAIESFEAGDAEAMTVDASDLISVTYLAFKDKRLLDIDAEESEFLFEDGLLKLSLGTVKNDVEVNQRKKDFEISILPRSNCVKEIE